MHIRKISSLLHCLDDFFGFDDPGTLFPSQERISESSITVVN